MKSSTHGLAVFFTGLSGAGKSTLATCLAARIESELRRPVTLLDGDEVRQVLSSGLGFSRSDRDLNIRRICYVAREVVKHGGIAICAQIAPYRRARDEARAYVGAAGGFVEVYVATPLEVCEARDPKGLYAKARAGEIEHFTGVNDPYEPPDAPDCILHTERATPAETLNQLWEHLASAGHLAPTTPGTRVLK